MKWVDLITRNAISICRPILSGQTVILWGLCVALNYASTSYPTLVALRVLLGCFESIVSSSCANMWLIDISLLTASSVAWYLLQLCDIRIMVSLMTSKSYLWGTLLIQAEQPLRVGIWFRTSGLAIIIGSLSSFGLQFYEWTAFNSWQYD